MSDRYISPHPLPTAYERELLVILVEEAAEVQKAVTKAIRFGAADGYPGSNSSNAQDLEKELGDLLAVVDLAVEAGLITHEGIEERKPIKRQNLAKYMQSEISK